MSQTHQLLLFIDVVQQGSFTKAASLHEMDNSALSKQIKKLETSLGVQLLNRSTRSFSLTSAGKEILEQAKILSGTLGQIQAIADSYQAAPTGMLRISAPVYFGQRCLQPVISDYLKRYPEVKISLTLDDRRSDLIADHFDLAFRIGKLRQSNLIARKIADTRFALVASEAFVAQYGMPKTPEQLLALPAVIYANPDITLDAVQLSEQPLGEQGGKTMKSHRMQGNYRVSDVANLVTAVRDGLGYSLIDLSNLDRPISELILVPLLTDYRLSTMETGIYALYPHRRQAMLASDFIEAVQAHIGSPPFWADYMPDYEQYYR
ncbi:LysR family transcriptional regulator [Ferrimonas pelagia]|uniref:LysR family transcriptional regulator n=1 Tax=Ferrimonas pelagia TaxID=1177826 RepID=A0ABP9ER58_9GAMM